MPATQEPEISEIAPPISLNAFFSGKPPRLWCLGNPAILNHNLLAIISARQIDSDLALKSSQLLKQLAFLKEVSFVSGWHSPLEEEALRILSSDSTRIVFCTSKALHRFKASMQIRNGINDGRVLLLTHCSPKAKRISRDASLRRNQLFVALAGALLVLSAPPGSASLKLAKSVLRHGKAVLTLEHRMNNDLLRYNALPATFDNIRTTLG